MCLLLEFERLDKSGPSPGCVSLDTANYWGNGSEATIGVPCPFPPKVPQIIFIRGS